MLRDHLADPEWLVTETGFDPDRANTFETLLTVGNGRLGTRGTLEEGAPGELSGTYLAGVYDDHDSPVIDLVNLPDWVDAEIAVNGHVLDLATCAVIDHDRALDLSQGLLWRRTVLEDSAGNRTRIESLRLASMAERDLCVQRLAVTLENHEGLLTIASRIDGRRRNLDRFPVYAAGTEHEPEVRWEKWTLTKHLADTITAATDDRQIYLQTRTRNSRIAVGYAAALADDAQRADRTVHHGHERVAEHLSTEAKAGSTVTVDRFVTIATSRDHGEVRTRAVRGSQTARDRGFEACLGDNRAAWERLWVDCDCRVTGDEQATHALRFGIYQLLIAADPSDHRVNIGAKSLTGEGYRGHVFWDTEVLMLPFFTYTQPTTARTLLRYRHHTLPAARQLAAEVGCAGARYPWESADTGREECPMFTEDGTFRYWSRDEEIHVSADVVYAIIAYLEATGDEQLLLDYGAEILYETSRFWVDRAEWDPATRRASIKQVMGPDEFHSHVDDNAFTNLLAGWALTQAADVHDRLTGTRPREAAGLAQRLGLTGDEVERWREVAAGLAWPLTSGGPVIEQFAGYFERLDVPITVWDDNDMPQYPEGYHHFNCEDTMLLKQPDVLMLLHMLPDLVDQDTKRANFEFYEARTLHKSSLSPGIHAIMGLTVGDPTKALQYFYRSALVDLADNQGNTAMGIHIASAAGTWQILVNGFGGFHLHHGQMAFDPWLPAGWQEIQFRLQWRGHPLDVAVTHEDLTLTLDADTGHTETVLVHGTPLTVTGGTPARTRLSSATDVPVP